MFREMRRKNQALDRESIENLLEQGSSGVLALAGDDGYPYAVPMSYVYKHQRIYMHSALTGHKIDSILKSDQVSFCVIHQDHVIPESFTTEYQSVIVFGRARVIQDQAEKRKTLEWLAQKYAPASEVSMMQAIEKGMDHMEMIEILIEHMTGKQAKELV